MFDRRAGVLLAIAANLCGCTPQFLTPPTDAGPDDTNLPDAFVPPPPPLGDIVAIAAGGDTGETYDVGRSCAVSRDHVLRCWGGPNAGDERPRVVDGLTDPIAVAIGGYHMCALEQAGTVRCWGRSEDVGALGDGRLSGMSDVPVAVSGISSATAIVAGLVHTCVLLADGHVQCWGANAEGTLGNGGTAASATPVTVVGVSDAVELSAGLGHNCVRTSVGGVQCWGFNSGGQVGDGSTSSRLMAVAVPGLTGVSAISAGGEFSCAVRTPEGNVYCWGFNGSGQLGDGPTVDHLAPARVSGVSGVSALTTGGAHACVIAAGAVSCWGYNGDAELGQSTTFVDMSPTPAALPQVPLARALAASRAIYSHTCALTAAANVYCWGSDYSGQLGGGVVGGHDYGVLVAE